MAGERRIDSVAVLGGGTMGGGIAGTCAQAGCRVLLLDVSREVVQKALDGIVEGRPAALDDPKKVDLITTGTIEADLAKIAEYDWICEAVIEDLETKRSVFARLEPLRRDGSVVSTNTSGIPLKAITKGMPERLRHDIAVTHFFNPVKVMKLMELVPGKETSPDVMRALADFCNDRLGKGVVYAKDTVNFIGNRIGCFFMLSGLHKAKTPLECGLTMEEVDALMGDPVGLPSTGLYGLIDLIGLDVIDLVAKNLEANLPSGDAGREFTRLPAAERAMLERGQLGRKSGGGFYRMIKREDGSRSKEVFDLIKQGWRSASDVRIDEAHSRAETLLFTNDLEGQFAWDLMGSTLCYAAGLVPEISDDIVNIDRALRWGYGWQKGPFELLDALGPGKVIARLEVAGKPIPKMLDMLHKADAEGFYRANGTEFLGLDGAFHRVPPA